MEKAITYGKETGEVEEQVTQWRHPEGAGKNTWIKKMGMINEFRKTEVKEDKANEQDVHRITDKKEIGVPEIAAEGFVAVMQGSKQ